MAFLTLLLVAFGMAASVVSAQSSTTVCTPTGCYQDNCYRNLAQSTAFCAAYTAPPTPGTTATVTLNEIQSSCGYSSLTSACSCLYPSGATVQATVPSITQCTTLPLAPSPTALNVNFDNGIQNLYIQRTHNVDNTTVQTDPYKSRSTPNSFRVAFLPEYPGSFEGRNLEVYVTGLMRPFTDYTFTFWARSDPLVDDYDAPTDYIVLYLRGLKHGPAPVNAEPSETPHSFGSRLLTPGLDTTWRAYGATFNSGEWPYFYIGFGFNNAGYTNSGVIPSLYIDDISIVQS